VRRGDVTLGRATYAHGAGAIVESIVMGRAMCAHGAGAIVEYRRSGAGASVFIGTCTWNHVISGSLSSRHGASSGCGWRNDFQYGG
jgi:hypothetical protein